MDNQKVVFFIDVDNTLLDNDHVKEEIKKSLSRVLGEDETNHFWQHHDEFREYKNLVDFPTIIRQYCSEKHKDTCELVLSNIFDNINFAHALYPQAYEALQHLKTLGKVILFTEGDNVYQKKKIQKSGLEVFADDVLLFEHKWEHFAEIVKQYEGRQHVLIDDRADPLVKAKQQFPHIFTIEVCQGHYATADHKKHQDLDMKIHTLSELLLLKESDIPNLSN